MNEISLTGHRARAILLTLIGASSLGLLMLIVRACFAQELRFGFLVWNLFLAWVPLIFATASWAQLMKPERSRWLLLGCLAGWFFFWPNAPYLVTDLVHLKTRAPIPRWYDILLFMLFAWTGLLLGYLSLFLMHFRVRRRYGSPIGWAFVGTVLAAGSFGVYLGRFLRLNSWDVLTRPLHLARDVVAAGNPSTNPEAALFSFSFFAFGTAVYAMLHALAHLHAPEQTVIAQEKPLP